jgi:hypothetical protein
MQQELLLTAFADADTLESQLNAIAHAQIQAQIQSQPQAEVQAKVLAHVLGNLTQPQHTHAQIDSFTCVCAVLCCAVLRAVCALCPQCSVWLSQTRNRGEESHWWCGTAFGATAPPLKNNARCV